MHGFFPILPIAGARSVDSAERSGVVAESARASEFASFALNGSEVAETLRPILNKFDAHHFASVV